MFKFTYIDGTTDEFFHKDDYLGIKNKIANAGLTLNGIAYELRLSREMLVAMLNGEKKISLPLKRYLIKNNLYAFN